jgi:hypothetical protein
VAQSPGPTEPKWGPADQVLAPFQIPLCQRVKEGRCTGYQMPKVDATMKLGCPATLAGGLAGLTSGPSEPHFQPKHRLKPPIKTPVLLPAEGLKKVRFSFL